MALSDWELWACANEVVRQQGPKAAEHASRRRVELQNSGNVAGAEVWELIERRVAALTRELDQETIRH